MKMKKSICAALLALGVGFGLAGTDISAVEAAPVNQIQAINVKADGSNFQYWNQGSESFKALKAYVEDVTNPKSPNYIPPQDRIAVSDMDGTFYGELAPTYSEWALYFHRIFEDPTYTPSATEKAYAEQCRQAAQEGKISADMDAGEDMAQAYAFEGMTLDEFDKYVTDWMNKTPVDGLTNCTFAESYYLPMVEVITYLQNNGFNFYVVTGTDRQLVRNALTAIPSIGTDHVIGTDSVNIAQRQAFAGPQYFQFEPGDVMSRGGYLATDNKMYKVSNICREIGKRPVLAMGNTGSDASMLNYAKYNDKYKTFVFAVLCDDSARDWGSAEKAAKMKGLSEKYGWQAVSMANDWKTIYGENVKKTASQKFRK